MGRGLGFAREGMSCHTSCNPPSPTLKTDTLSPNPRSLLPQQPYRRTSKSDTPPISPYPSSPQLFVMAWRGLFRGKLTMSGISGVTGKNETRVLSTKEGLKRWGRVCKPKGTDTPTPLNRTSGCIGHWKSLNVATTISLISTIP